MNGRNMLKSRQKQIFYAGKKKRRMSMNATVRVINTDRKTVGYVIGGSFVTTEEARANSAVIENLSLDDRGQIQTTDPFLPELTLHQVYRHIYEKFAEKYNLNREIQDQFEAWKKYKSDYVLYLSGARQTGKTTEIKKFIYKNYENILYIDLSIDKLRISLEQCMQDTQHTAFAFANFCVQNRMTEFTDSVDTVIVLDEIQESIAVYNLIRQMKTDLKCHVIVTGSYLGKTVNSQYFKPAGDVWNLEMLPLSFTEFCDAFGCKELLLAVDLSGKSDGETYKKLYKLYRIYIQIGGYPAVVNEYRKSKSIPNCLEVLEKLIQTFTDESASYFSDDKCRLIFENVYKAAFHMMAYEKKGTSAKDIQKVADFVKDSTKENVSRNEVNRAVAWLKYSKIISGCDLYNQGKISELLSERRFYFMDCGIANCISRMTPVDNETVRGILTENFAYTELYRLYQSDRVKGDKPCCSVYNEYELDFMIVDKDDKKYGIEIKSTDADKPVSLMVYLDQHIIEEGYLAGKTRGGIRKDIYSIPVYTVGCRFPYR